MGIALALVTTCSQGLLITALDFLAQAQAIGIGFPLAIGSSIIGFNLYSSIRLKEPFTPTTLVGLALGITGIILLSLA